MMNTNESQITFSTFDLVVSRLSDIDEYLESVDFVFIDEAHHSEAFTYRTVLENYQKSRQGGYNIIGLTATPFRTEDTEFSHFKQNFNCFEQLTNQFDEQIESPIQYLIDRQFLAQIDYRILENSANIPNESEYFKLLNTEVLKVCQETERNKNNMIIFAKSKSHAIALSIYLRRSGIKNGLIVGETPDSLRKKHLKEFGDKTNDLNILVNHLILSTGIDVPGMNSIMVLGDIKSPSLGLQILGRAMRGPKNGGNSQNTIYLTQNNYLQLKDFKLLESTVLN